MKYSPSNLLYFFTAFLFLYISVNAQHYPGGVPGAEAWYMVNHEDMESNIYKNSANNDIEINPCGLAEKKIFNFNPSMYTGKLCLSYMAALENTTSRNIFFVEMPKDISLGYSHLTTRWNSDLPNSQTDSIIKNRFDLGDKSSYILNLSTEYESVSNANVNFYRWNNYRMDRKFKSYGVEGETEFFIGMKFVNPITEDDQTDFSGNFPEYISFPFELNENEVNRVESYLSLKYGVTLNKTKSYKNSKNIVFWDKSNNDHFGNDIFGVGKDDISSLNQLISMSEHQKDYLISSVGSLAPTNLDKQNEVNIPNNNFIVYGDNGYSDGLDAVNSVGVRPLRKKWLAQNTGKYSKDFRMSFALDTDGVIKNYLNSMPHHKIWMLHDPYVNNQSISDYDNNYIEYYEVQDMVLGGDHALFKDVNFSTDGGIYDQFTFGVGPEMIVEVRYSRVECGDNKIKNHVVVFGGSPKYNILIYNNDTYQESVLISENMYSFYAETGYSYTVVVTDENGLQQTVEYDLEIMDIDVDFGPSQYLTTAQPEITLDAGQDVNDSEATYQWYKDGQLLPQQNSSTLTIDEPGLYEVIITSGDRSCSVKDKIEIVEKNGFSINSESSINCNSGTGNITVNIFDGLPVYEITIEGLNNNNSYYGLISNTQKIFENVSIGTYSVNVKDGNDVIVNETVEVLDPSDGIEIDLLGQLELYTEILNYDLEECGCPLAVQDGNETFTLDASLLVTNSNITYEWFANGISMGIYDPIVELEHNSYGQYPQDQGVNLFEVVVTNENTGCSVSEKFMIRSHIITDHHSARPSGEGNEDELASKRANNKETRLLTTVVYPNPSDSHQTFYYKVQANEVTDINVEIFNMLGQTLYEIKFTGKSSYILPYSLTMSGVYFIKTTSTTQSLTDEIIIR